MPARLNFALITATLMIAGCAQESAPEAPAEMAAPAAAPAVMRSAAPAGAEAYIIAPADGATVTSPVAVAFGLRGIGVAPAGIDLPNTGHHHLLIDTELANFDSPIPANAQHVHFGLGQTETTVELAPGRHELRLVLGDHLHTPHDPPVTSDVVTITVSP
ncbi:MAG: DUF4399 domain-containing protein [Gammaproteobacteria bacterium]|nr:DUF4399 domain-containing protein [Gammaproteobacteria bacterium]MDH3505525.1 DUF4399 domain-containing protein [Gammaproteobacteria bacterium]